MVEQRMDRAGLAFVGAVALLVLLEGGRRTRLVVRFGPPAPRAGELPGGGRAPKMAAGGEVS